ncbi:hypothetical protein [Pirellulimonas nuda]|uniref:hypothetical protein n=1 Tax=Pirellulimonas nuda TaxID=2528009 RepID=UPI00119D5704|nr:hypothetical protein [Pirellulimonas nuda]
MAPETAAGWTSPPSDSARTKLPETDQSTRVRASINSQRCADPAHTARRSESTSIVLADAPSVS